MQRVLVRKENPMNQTMNQLTTMNGIFSSEALNNLPAIAKRSLRNDGAMVVKQTAVANLAEQGRAVVANTALENVGSLSALEDHLCQIAPGGSDRYKAIVDAYTLGAAQRIARW
jgi:hypothetical protein